MRTNRKTRVTQAQTENHSAPNAATAVHRQSAVRPIFEQRATNNQQLTTNNYQLTTNNYQLTTKPFTLIELMVAVALGGIILAVAVTAFQQTSEVSSAMKATTEATHNARAAMLMLSRDLENAYIEPGMPDFTGRDQSQSEIEFPTLMESDTVLYKVEDTTTGGETITTLQRDTRDEGGAAAFGIRDFRLRYYYDDGDGNPTNDWFSAWDSGEPNGADGNPGTADDIQYRRIPEVVEVTIEVIDSNGLLDNPRYNSVRMRRLIELPNGSE